MYLSGTWCHRNGRLGRFKRWQQAREPVQRYVIPYNSLYVNVPYTKAQIFYPVARTLSPCTLQQLLAGSYINWWGTGDTMPKSKQFWWMFKINEKLSHIQTKKGSMALSFVQKWWLSRNQFVRSTISFLCQLFIHQGLGSILPWTTVSLVMQLVVLPS